MIKKSYTLICLMLASGITAFSQTPVRQIDKGNVREGESVEYCITHKKKAEALKDPHVAAAYAQAQSELKSKPGNGTEKGTVYIIPVVFHILHNNGPENISKAQIDDAMIVLNRDYRLQNADAANVHPNFAGLPGDVEIEFQLATKAPNGTCFSGVTRTVSALTSNGSDGNAQLSAAVNGNDVYQGTWPANKYLNILVAADIGGAAGYTYNPGIGTSMSFNSIWVLHNYVGRNGTSSESTSRTLTHEVGHWLNLEHVWGGNNNPGSAACNADDDGVQDTPLCVGSTSCIVGANTCNDLNDPNNWSSWTFDAVDNYENYMDYSYCSKMFTPNQITRMRNALTSSTSGRNNLITAANHLATGINMPLTLCKAQFAAEKTTVCVGETLNFTDMSYNLVTGWSWTFAGGTPATSTSQNPSVTYSTPGVYTVTLQATDGGSSNTETKTAYITVLPQSNALPYLETFEGFTAFAGTDWRVVGTGQKWEITNTAGHTGTKSVKINNFSQATGEKDQFYSVPFDLSGITSATGATLTFRYAYRKKTAANTDVLNVSVTNNCGETYALRKSLSASTMSSGTTNTTSAFTPSSQADWKTVHVTNITSSYWVNNLVVEFELESGGGNNVYIDNINIYSGPSNDNLVTSIDENTDFANVSLYPNPAENEFQVVFNSTKESNEMTVVVKDLSGKVVQSHAILANVGTNEVYVSTEGLSAGAYFVTLTDGTASKTMQLIKK